MLAKLTTVWRDDNYVFRSRQVPMIVDIDLTMVIQFSENCEGCHNSSQKDMNRFKIRCSTLTQEEIEKAMSATCKEIEFILAQKVPCVGCRRSVEQMLQELVFSGRPSIDPLNINKQDVLTINKDKLQSAESIYSLLYLCGSGVMNIIHNIQMSKKTKRCSLHSMDMHKSKSLGFVISDHIKNPIISQALHMGWIDVWHVLSDECREEILIVDPDDLLYTLDKYLKKHRFCLECKGKVLRAYSILNGDVEVTTGPNQEPIDKGYNPKLYRNLKCCPSERHLHVTNDTELVSHLINKGAPDLLGNRRERHAKTMDIAQDEVLTCLGIYLGERLIRIKQKLRDEEQTWQLCYAVCTETLRKNFELAIEKKQGISNLELLCHELDIEESEKITREKIRKQKKRNKKNAAKQIAKEQQAEQQAELQDVV